LNRKILGSTILIWIFIEVLQILAFPKMPKFTTLIINHGASCCGAIIFIYFIKDKALPSWLCIIPALIEIIQSKFTCGCIDINDLIASTIGVFFAWKVLNTYNI
jgi:glycopeptide antibiotics resistance protein